MKLCAPEYYKKFTCIADKCTHSCCIGWEIDVDEETLEKYNALKCGYGEEIIKSIETEGVPHFKLGEKDRCLHLDSHGLCKIIKNLGEGYLCHICREHPRFYNYTNKGAEVGLGMSCEEACRIILSSDYRNFVSICDEESGESENNFDRAEIWCEPENSFDQTEMGCDDFCGVDYREKIYSVLSNKNIPYTDRLSLIYKEYGVSPQILSDGAWREVLSSLEYLDEGHKELFSVYSSDIATDIEHEKMLERFLAYFVFRHCSAVFDKEEFVASLGFSLFCERLFSSLLKFRKEYETKSGNLFRAKMDSLSGTKGDIVNDEMEDMVFKNAETCFRLARIISEELEYSEDNTEALKAEFWV